MEAEPISEVLAREAEAAERVEAEHRGPYVRSQRAPHDPSQVYSLRIPVQCLDTVRKLAREHNTTPAALLRTWVLERLEEEAVAGASADDDLPQGQRHQAMALIRRLEATLRRSA